MLLKVNTSSCYMFTKVPFIGHRIEGIEQKTSASIDTLLHISEMCTFFNSSTTTNMILIFLQNICQLAHILQKILHLMHISNEKYIQFQLDFQLNFKTHFLQSNLKCASCIVSWHHCTVHSLARTHTSLTVHKRTHLHQHTKTPKHQQQQQQQYLSIDSLAVK